MHGRRTLLPGIPGPTQSALEFGENEQLHLYGVFSRLMEDTENGSFSPCIVYDKDDPVEYAAFHLEQYADMRIVPVESISALLEQYYAEEKHDYPHPAEIRRPAPSGADGS